MRTDTLDLWYSADVAGAKAHIIYIDDSTVELDKIGRTLKDAGYQVTTCVSISEVKPHLAGTDLVLIDYHMPGMNGREVLVALRELTAKLPTPPVFYLYTSDKERGANYKELGFDGRVILKGNDAALLRQVGSALRIRSLAKLQHS